MMLFQGHQTEKHLPDNFNRYCWLLISLLAVLSLYDLMLPQFTAPTILRQAQTAMLTENFTREGFTIKGLYLNIFGNEKPIMAFEFPIYNFIVGLLFLAFGANLFWGKLVSFLAATLCLVCICRLLKDAYNQQVAIWAGLFFVLSPLGMMMRTAFQPDAMALMFVLLSLLALRAWHDTRSASTIILFSILLLMGGLAKFPVIVPFLPLISLALFSRNDRFRLPGIRAIAIIAVMFVLPFLSWYLFRGQITHPSFGNAASERSAFLLGDLRRFLSLWYYVNPIYSITTLACSGIGLLFFLFGLRNLSPVAKALLIGIPFYFIIIPTVKDQHYYLFACTPIFALFMARGWLGLSEMCNVRRLTVARYALFIIFAAGFSAMSLYAIVLRNDRVMLDTARTVKSLTAPDDLVFAVTMHNRTAIFGGPNPTFFYLAQRKGWNADLGLFTKVDQDILGKIAEQAQARRRQGAKWMVISWYTPDLESAVESYIPVSAKTRIDPGIDGSVVFTTLNKQYPTAFQGKNYAVLKL